MSKYTTETIVVTQTVDEEASSSIFDSEHTPSNPYCGDASCWCHINVSYHEIVTGHEATPEEIEDTYAFLELQYAGGGY